MGKVAALSTFALLNAADLLSTWMALGLGLHESNPFMSMLLAQHGFGALIAWKVLVVAAAALTMALLWPTSPALTAWFLVGVDALVAVAVVSNLVQMAPAAMLLLVAWLCIVAGVAVLAWAAVTWLERDQATMAARVEQWHAPPRHWWPEG